VTLSGLLNLPLEQGLGRIVDAVPGVRRRATSEGLPLVVGMKGAIGGPYVNADARGSVIPLRRLGCPVQECGAEAEVCVAPPDDDAPDVHGQPVTVVRLPDWLSVGRARFLDIESDGPGYGGIVPDQPRFAVEQVIDLW
jgi:hypothetical protein